MKKIILSILFVLGSILLIWIASISSGYRLIPGLIINFFLSIALGYCYATITEPPDAL